jgi:hypothetical protein
VTNSLDGYLTEHGYAAQRGVTVRTLQRERRLRTGPPWLKVGARVMYRIVAIQNWMLAREHQPVRERVA